MQYFPSFKLYEEVEGYDTFATDNAEWRSI